MHEEALRGDLAELAARIAGMKRLKGEIVLVVAGKPADASAFDDDQLTAMLRAELEGQRLRDAVKSVVETTGLPRNRIYRLALALTADQDTEPEQDG
jgi:16S rRNA (cytidine1402-2'-O)-methyltransferase